MVNLSPENPYVHLQQVLFGLEKGGKFKVWSIEVSESIGGKGIITIHHGQEGGKQTRKDEVLAEGFQGRNPVEQAVFEARARIKKQLDKNYRATKEELTDLPVLAMLSKDHTKDGKAETVEKGVYTSDKLDGVRCLAKCTESGVVLESRTGQPYDVPHIVAELSQFMKPGDILDGELYVHGPSLQEITSAVKRTDSEQKWGKAEAAYMKYAERSDCTQVKCDELAEKLSDAKRVHDIRQSLEFHVFDIVELDVPFCERRNNLAKYAMDNFMPGGCIVEVKYRFAISIEELNKQLKDCIDRGFEGIMYRTQDGLYESGKRSAGLWKYKLFFDEEFKIIGVGVDKQGYAVFELLNNVNAEEFNCVLGDYNWRTEAVKQKELYIGKWMTVQYQSRYKGTLLPQFPTGKLIREGSVVDGKFIPSE
ncbi:ATP-dependent DNA ligase [Pseudomonas phage vB_PpuM-NoPa]|uniref:DNA ligase n=1 Tax=Pseudomonas phage vB_PpuM-NoPa TaxID=3132619 RepID=A0AAX4MXS7_9CAUD